MKAHSDGTMHWAPGGRFSTSCHLNVRLYPFDRQKCELKFSTWSHTNNTMQLHSAATRVNTDEYSPHGQWELEWTSVRQVTSRRSTVAEKGHRRAALAYIVHLLFASVLRVYSPSHSSLNHDCRVFDGVVYGRELSLAIKLTGHVEFHACSVYFRSICKSIDRWRSRK